MAQSQRSLSYALWTFIPLLVVSVIGITALPSAAADTFNVQVTASPAVPLTHAYLIVGDWFTQATVVGDPRTYRTNWVNDIIALGNLPAATSASPDVITVTASTIETPFFGGGVDHPFDTSIENGMIVAHDPTYALIALYRPGGVSVTDPFPLGDGSFYQTFGDYTFYTGTEQDIANALATGDTATLTTFWEPALWSDSQHLGTAVPLVNFSAGTPAGSVDAVIVAPEPHLSLCLAAVFAIVLTRRH